MFHCCAMRDMNISELESVRGGVGQPIDGGTDPGGASDGVCYPAPDDGGACYADTNYSHVDYGETWTGGTW